MTQYIVDDAAASRVVTTSAPAEDEKLPFEPFTLIKSIWCWRWWLGCWVVLCAVGGVILSWMFAPQIWTAETVVMYQPPSEDLVGGLYEPPTITTQLNMVKVKENLSEVRVQLSLPYTLEKIASAVKVDNPKASDLLHFRVSWHEPEGAAKIARTLRDRFTQQQKKLRRKDLSVVMREVQTRLDNVRVKIRAAGDPALIAKEEERRSKQKAVLQNRMENAASSYDVTRGEIRSIERQIEEIQLKIKTEKERIAESSEAANATDSLSNLNMRLERLGEMIDQRRQARVDENMRESWKKKLAWNENALAEGVITKAQYDADVKAYENWRARVEDDPIIAELKKEREDIFKRMTNRGPAATTTTAELANLESSLLRLELNRTGLLEKAKDQEQRKKQLEKELFEFQDYRPERTATDPKLLLEWRTEEDNLADSLAGLRTLFDKNESDFRIVSDVETPRSPSRSYRKIGVVAFCVFGAFGAFVCVGVWELLDTRVKSRAESELRFKLPVLGLLPDVARGSNVMPEGWEERLFEPIRGVVRRMRARLPHNGAKILVVSCGVDEGCTTVAGHLARCFGQQGESVLLVDGDVRQTKAEDSLRQIVVSNEPQIRGLGDFLTASSNRLTEVMWPTTLFGVHTVPRSLYPIVPELLSSKRMLELMREAGEKHDVVLIDGPPAASNADAEILASLVDGIVVVVQARRFRSREVKKVIERLTATGAPILGLVLNRVEPMFMDAD